MAKHKRCESVARVVEFAAGLGFQVEATRGDHLKFTKPGRKTVFFSKTPGDRRAPLNAMSNIQKSERGVL